jgi:Peptidase C39 family
MSGPRRRFIVPEVVQTSAMDCGPASLKCMLEGFGIPVSYGRLREACQTDVDGTSIDTMEEIAVELGLDANQVMIPADYLFMPQAQALPALAVVRTGNNLLHFVILWRRIGNLVQVMDPDTGAPMDYAQASARSHLYPHDAGRRRFVARVGELGSVSRSDPRPPVLPCHFSRSYSDGMRACAQGRRLVFSGSARCMRTHARRAGARGGT